MLKKGAILLLWLIGLQANAQTVLKDPNNPTYKGYLTMGVRNTLSTFNGGEFEYNGMGVGGHFRVPIIPRINTEWFADYISNNIGNMAHRADYHIGWSVMYYVISPYKVQHTSTTPFIYTRRFNPFIEAGHCFDYTDLRVNGATEPTAKRWSSAVQAGMGTHINLSQRFDITVKTQYMMHLGNDIHAHVRDGQLEIEEHEHGGIEGHLLFTLSVNYKLIKLWEKAQ